ncbi:MAG: tRNA (adenosine(37)-N6)-threonylcarbamoyltransferase complex dimerization subunit type 1 TsaB [Methylophilaceae bacterium]
MNILALDTSTEYLSLALSLQGKVFVRELLAGQSHSQHVLPLLRELLDEAKVALTDLDGIAFGAGPGSFTGLRIGCGIAQGLAFGANLPVVGIGTLMALAESAGSPKVIACLDARMGEVYHAAYIKTSIGWQEEVAPGLYKPGAVPAILGNDWAGVGSGWATFSDALHAAYAGQLSDISPEIFPHAIAIAALALPDFSAGRGVSAAEAAPVYIRNKVALKISER